MWGGFHRREKDSDEQRYAADGWSATSWKQLPQVFSFGERKTAFLKKFF